MQNLDLGSLMLIGFLALFAIAAILLATGGSVVNEGGRAAGVTSDDRTFCTSYHFTFYNEKCNTACCTSLNTPVSMVILAALGALFGWGVLKGIERWRR